jgi:membrane fusion protein (multidrug efflux system)
MREHAEHDVNNDPHADQDENPQAEDGMDDGQGGGEDNQEGKKDKDKDKPNPEEAKKKSRTGLLILGSVILFLALTGVLYAFLTRNQESTDDAYTEGNVVTIAPKVSGYVIELDVNDNSFVHAGQVMLRIDPRDYIYARDQARANLALAQAQLVSAQANYEIQKVQIPAKLTQAQAQKAQAEANRVQADLEYRRQHNVDVRATTRESIDTANAQQQSAASQVVYNQAQVDVAKLVPQNLRQAKAQVEQLQAQVDQAKAQLEQAELNLSWTEVRAPQDGWVTLRNVQLGSYAQVGQSIFQLVATDVWVVANYKETQLDRMRICQRVDMTVDAHPGLKLTGHIDTIQMGSGSRFSAFPAENATGNYVKIVQRVPVKIVLDHNDNLPLPIGLSVIPTVRLGSEKNCNNQQREAQ